MSEEQNKAVEIRQPEFIPVSVGFLPATWFKYQAALEELILRHPIIFGPWQKGSRPTDAQGTYSQGEHIDAWGCAWSNIHHGIEAYVTKHPLPKREMVNEFVLPAPGAGLPHGFMFIRLIYLRGYEELMLDFAEEPPELQRLINLVLAYNVRELERMLADNGADTIYFGDDLGAQRSLPISPAKWRKYLKPCFAKLYGLCHKAGRKVYMHTDGHIIPIIKDLIECGVDVLNPQFRANGLDLLVWECKGKVGVNLDLDRQMFPFCTPEEIDAHIRLAVEKLGAPEGGLSLLAECGPDVPLENIEAICRALEKYRGYYRSRN